MRNDLADFGFWILRLRSGQVLDFGFGGVREWGYNGFRHTLLCRKFFLLPG